MTCGSPGGYPDGADYDLGYTGKGPTYVVGFSGANAPLMDELEGGGAGVSSLEKSAASTRPWSVSGDRISSNARGNQSDDPRRAVN